MGIGGVIYGMQGHGENNVYVTWCTMESSGVKQVEFQLHSLHVKK